MGTPGLSSTFSLPMTAQRPFVFTGQLLHDGIHHVAGTAPFGHSRAGVLPVQAKGEWVGERVPVNRHTGLPHAELAPVAWNLALHSCAPSPGGGHDVS